MYRCCKMNVDESIKKVVLELTTCCNLSCHYCIYSVSNNSCSFGFLSKKALYNLIDKFSEKDIYKVVLTGGEPTLHPDFLDISRYAISKIPKVSVCTNGVFLSEDLENGVVDLDFSTYTISVDSHKDEIHDELRGLNGSLQRTLAFIDKLRLRNKNVSIHVVLHPRNIDSIEDTIKFCKNLAPEVVVSSICHYDKIFTDPDLIKDYVLKTKGFYEKYKDSPEVTIVGFGAFCKNKKCLDQKNIFMVNSGGDMITCYWKKNGGKIIKRY
jgi:MoaA/NifB/PqqE/SkfB family radical SAM enzyme